jgi:tRNA (guanosine-2'-O-)-methyltransferase
MDFATQQALVEYFSSYISDHKRSRIEEVLNYRTRHLTVVLEDIYQPQNASAIVRTCDIFGVQDLHIIENKNYYELNPEVVKGSSKWVNMNQYNSTRNNTAQCLEQLKKKKYKILATSPSPESLSINDISLDHKTALVFGTEHTGVSDIVKEYADEMVTIPMFGFTESFNVSVSAALCLNSLITNMHASDADWRLSEEEKVATRLDWYRKIVVNADMYENRFFEDANN